MKKILVLSLLMLEVFLTSANDPSVYICTGPKSKRYHKTEDCKGLSNCSGEIQKVSLEKAKDMGRTACKMCYKKK